MQNTTIIVPCFNEEIRLDQKAFLNFSKTDSSFHFCFVDDGSTDNTSSILKKLKAKNPDNFSVLEINVNQGKAEAVRQGMVYALKNITSNWYGYLDADLSTDLAEVKRLTSFFSNEKKFIFGSRFQRLGSNINRKTHRHYLGRFFATLVSKLLQLRVYDTQCGAKFFQKQLALQLFDHSFKTKWIFDVEIFFRIQQVSNYNIENIAEEIPLNRWKDIAGSKIRLIDFLKIPIELIKIFRNYKLRF